MRPYISYELCDRCNECVEACPYDVFSNESGEVKATNTGDCIECTSCVELCPNKAIYMDD
ncbi:4Fe-4S binding protein [Syntrophorhabdus aromaticivorans]|uniref:4Fe-4S binding protein n=1 Tax=Syntrophorhabdus aromaticivorans TaxID=328301 RepID=A0A971S2X2_9BACT|nr:4Fe-4S binding protein [Syntrophorhabdus aromaticivorans]